MLRAHSTRKMWIHLISSKNDAEDLGVEALEFSRQSTSQARENTCGDVHSKNSVVPNVPRMVEKLKQPDQTVSD